MQLKFLPGMELEPKILKLHKEIILRKTCRWENVFLLPFLFIFPMKIPGNKDEPRVLIGL